MNLFEMQSLPLFGFVVLYNYTIVLYHFIKIKFNVRILQVKKNLKIKEMYNYKNILQ